jgi:hypothetical protein
MFDQYTSEFCVCVIVRKSNIHMQFVQMIICKIFCMSGSSSPFSYHKETESYVDTIPLFYVLQQN